MFAVATTQGIPWPPFDATGMQGLMAYLSAAARRDPPADERRGQLRLVHKGCLECHAVRGEGARIGPDLTSPRPAYGSAAAWAAAMWTHSPRMAAKAAEMGVMYPRFTDNEVGSLVSYLRSAAR
jgi:mono/diheme cytochrome c family protein